MKFLTCFFAAALALTVFTDLTSASFGDNVKTFFTGILPDAILETPLGKICIEDSLKNLKDSGKASVEKLLKQYINGGEASKPKFFGFFEKDVSFQANLKKSIEDCMNKVNSYDNSNGFQEACENVCEDAKRYKNQIMIDLKYACKCVKRQINKHG